MLLNTYDPDGEAYCKYCNKAQKTKTLGGNLAYYPRYIEVKCTVCSKDSRIELDKSNG